MRALPTYREQGTARVWLCQTLRTPDGERLVEVSCWTTPLEYWRGGTQTGWELLERPLPVAEGAGTSVYYCPNDGSEDVLLWGPGLAGGGALISVPRLALGYYLLIAAALAAVLGAAWALLLYAAFLVGRALWENRRIRTQV